MSASGQNAEEINGKTAGSRLHACGREGMFSVISDLNDKLNMDLHTFCNCFTS